MTVVTRVTQPNGRTALRLIAVFKLCKAFGLLLVAVAAFGLVRQATLDSIAAWIASLPIQHGHRFLVDAMDYLLQLGPRKFIAIGAAACVYAGLFTVEGFGLWRGKRWAEYLTVIATASLIPLELWEIYHRFNWLKLAAFAVNVAIVWYLIALLRRQREH